MNKYIKKLFVLHLLLIGHVMLPIEDPSINPIIQHIGPMIQNGPAIAGPVISFPFMPFMMFIASAGMLFYLNDKIANYCLCGKFSPKQEEKKNALEKLHNAHLKSMGELLSSMPRSQDNVSMGHSALKSPSA